MGTRSFLRTLCQSRAQTSQRFVNCGFLWVIMLVATASDLTAEQKLPKWMESARSGPWSAAGTWKDNRIPGAGDRVHVLPGHVITYDMESDQPLRAVYVAGRLAFSREQNTRLEVGVLKIEGGESPSEEGFDCTEHFEEPAPGEHRPVLEVGTAADPIPAGKTALIRLRAAPGQDPDSCPAILCCGGRMEFHGAPLSRAWVKLGVTAPAGEKTVTLGEEVTGWKVGDRLIITATVLGRDIGQGSDQLQTEERSIVAMDGPRITLDQPLKHQHLGEGEFRGEVANLSRNVIVESAQPEGLRGHTMYHKGSTGSISYAEFRHLGKRDVLGRYSLHFHLVGNSMRGGSVVGASIWDSHNRWLTIHGTNYLVVRDCVGYQSIGHGYFLEDGTEVLNVLDRNLAVQAMDGKKLPKQVLPFDQNDGAGFWWANCFNAFTRNVACENNRYGFRYEATETSSLKLTLPVQQADGTIRPVDIRTLPFVRFADNEAHCDGLYGINLGEGVNRIGPDAQHPLVVRNTRIWEIHYAFRPQSPSLLVDGLTIHNSIYGVYHPNFDRHVYRNVTIQQIGPGGDAEPFNRGHDDDSIQYGSLTVDGLTFAGHRDSSMPLIQISDENPSGQAESHFRNVRVIARRDRDRRALVNLGGGPRPTPKSATSVPVFLHDYFGPGRAARVVSMKSGEFRSAGANTYRHERTLTGDESRVSEIENPSFPQLLDPVDDQPPATVITHVRQTTDGWLIQGTASDNGTIRQVLINDRPATSTRGDFEEWQITLKTLPANQTLQSTGTDIAGNTEVLPHVVALAESSD